MKKALCFLLAVIFVCCVYVHGEDKRFSLEAMITNLTNFEDMPSIQDVVACWQKPSYTFVVDDMPRWIEFYSIRETTGGLMEFYYAGKYPLAYEDDGTLTTRYPYEWIAVYNDNGTWNENPANEDGLYPIITKHNKEIYYDDYDGDDSILEFLESIKAFFMRCYQTIKVVVEIVVCIFDNLEYLLPWNSTVPKGV